MQLLLCFTYAVLAEGIKDEPWEEHSNYFGAIEWPSGFRFPEHGEEFYFHVQVMGKVWSLEWHVYPQKTVPLLNIHTSCPESVMRQCVRKGQLHHLAPLEDLLFGD